MEQVNQNPASDTAYRAIESEQNTSTTMSASRVHNLSDPSPRRRSRSQHHHELRTKVKILKLMLALSGVVLLLLFLLAGVFISAVSSERNQVLFEYEKQKMELATARADFDQMRAKLDALVQGRLPDLRLLEYDTTIPIASDVVRNITFTLLREDDNQAYEYRLVLHNDSLSVVYPDVSLFLFDDRGIQVGIADLSEAGSSGDPTRLALDAGEVRSYSGRINLIRGETPRYFLLSTDQ